MKKITKFTIGFFLSFTIIFASVCGSLIDRKNTALASSPDNSIMFIKNAAANSDKLLITEKDAVSAIDVAISKNMPTNMPTNISYSGSEVEILDNNRIILKSYFTYKETNIPFSLTVFADFCYNKNILTVKIDKIKLSKVSLPSFAVKNIADRLIESSPLSAYSIDKDKAILININDLLSKYGQDYKVSSISSREGELIIGTSLVEKPKTVVKSSQKKAMHSKTAATSANRTASTSNKNVKQTQNTSEIVEEVKNTIVEIQTTPAEELNISEIIGSIKKANSLDNETKSELIQLFQSTTSPEKQKELYELYKKRFS